MQAKIVRMKCQDPRRAALKAVELLEKNPHAFYYWSATKKVPAAGALADSFITHGSCANHATTFLTKRNLMGCAIGEGMIVAAHVIDQAVMVDRLGFDAACVEIAARRFLAGMNVLEDVKGPIQNNRNLNMEMFSAIDAITDASFHGGAVLRREAEQVMKKSGRGGKSEP